ncbi:MAG: 2Fe-2S iron-sulfur cluster-binding protein, partial [Methanomicrobiales archaeon]|nr:2Fe-2S iron-sulfur cluster-binding protein [Methanomicrobiales archaeon]
METGKTILSHLQEAGAPVTAHCGGRGECRACAIRIDRQDLLSPKTEVEASLLGDPLMRLACQATVVKADGTLRVELPRYSRYSIVERGLRPAVPLSPLVELTGKGRSLEVSWGGRVLGPYDGEIFGVALDIGTTTLAMRWLDLEDRQNPDRFSASVLNPQIRFGDNVIERIRYAMETPGGARHLQNAVIGAVNTLLSCGAVRPDHIYEMTVAG